MNNKRRGKKNRERRVGDIRRNGNMGWHKKGRIASNSKRGCSRRSEAVRRKVRE